MGAETTTSGNDTEKPKLAQNYPEKMGTEYGLYIHNIVCIYL